MKTLDKANLAKVRAAMDVELAKLGKKLGLAFATGKCVFSEENCVFQVKVSTISDTGEVLTAEATNFIKFAHLYGINPKALGKTYTDPRGLKFEVLGMRSGRAVKSPFLVGQEGKKFTVSGDYLAKYFPWKKV
jgi:hypothetical protein